MLTTEGMRSWLSQHTVITQLCFLEVNNVSPCYTPLAQFQYKIHKLLQPERARISCNLLAPARLPNMHLILPSNSHIEDHNISTTQWTHNTACLKETQIRKTLAHMHEFYSSGKYLNQLENQIIWQAIYQTVVLTILLMK